MRKSEGTRQRDNLGDPCVWEDNTKMDHQEVGCGVMDCIELAEDRDRWRAVATAVKNFRVP